MSVCWDDHLRRVNLPRNSVERKQMENLFKYKCAPMMEDWKFSLLLGALDVATRLGKVIVMILAAFGLVHWVRHKMIKGLEG